MPERLEHLLLVTTEDPYSVSSWSGIPFSLRSALERRLAKVTTFRPSRPKRTPLAALLRVLRGSRRRPLWITNATLRQNAAEVQREIHRTHPDAVLSISSQCVALLTGGEAPIFLFSDAPYLAFSSTYAEWETAPDELHRFAGQEAAAARRSAGCFFSSAWACDEAARLYGLSKHPPAALLHLAPLGANWTPSLGREEIFALVHKRGFDRMELLFVGRDWERKGGPLAVEIAQSLASAGQPVMLHIVGCRPSLDTHATQGIVTIHGLLRQDVASESERLEGLFLNSHFLLVPTRAECFGIVFAEAQAFALPPVSRAVQALPSVVVDGETGVLLAPDAPASVYAERLLALFGDPERYLDMAYQARSHYETVLNWDQTAETIVSGITAALHRSHPS